MLTALSDKGAPSGSGPMALCRLATLLLPHYFLNIFFVIFARKSVIVHTFKNCIASYYLPLMKVSQILSSEQTLVLISLAILVVAATNPTLLVFVIEKMFYILYRSTTLLQLYYRICYISDFYLILYCTSLYTSLVITWRKM